MHYVVSARLWNDKFQHRFGAIDSLHRLTCSDIIALMIIFGRARITKGYGTDPRSLRFENDYD
jgi:hypothetical protein